MMLNTKNIIGGNKMGFAKYQEDIVSRFVADQALRRKTVVVAPPTDGKISDSDTVFTNSQNTTRKSPMSSLKKFAIATPRPLPVIILADTSGSMSVDGKIEALNTALKDLVASLSKESRLRAQLQLGLITFGGTACTHLPLTAVQGITAIIPLPAIGATPMGQAFELARQLLEDKTLIPSRAYRPVLILLSDGLPTDDWQAAFDALCQSERAQKATRLAMAIGADADEAMLSAFANDMEAPLFKAHNARDIHRFFRAVSLSVRSRSASQNPDESVVFVVPPDDSGALDLDFE